MTKVSQIVEMYKAGKTSVEICRALGTRRSQVHLALLKNGLKSPRPSGLPEPVQEAIRSEYSDGMSVRELCGKYGMSRFQAEKVLSFDLRKHSDSNHIAGVRAARVLTQEQEQLLLGSLLGDASISRNANRGYYVRMAHSWKQVGYAEHKSQALGAGPVHAYKNSGFSELPLATFVFKNARASKWLEPLVLRDGKKHVTESWAAALGPRAAAYWFMDDGFSSQRKYGVTAGFATCGFDAGENQRLQAAMIRLGVETTITKSPSTSGTGYMIMVRSSSTPALMDMIAPYVWPIECMRYKVKYRR